MIPADSNWTPIQSAEPVDAAHVISTAGTPVLGLRFKRSGNIYLYAGVPRYVFRGLISAPSAGLFLASFVFYRYRCVPSTPAELPKRRRDA